MTEMPCGNAGHFSSSTAPPRVCSGAARTLIAAIAIAAVLVGCGARHSSAKIKSYKDPYFPETYGVNFDECVFRTDAGGDYHLVALAIRQTEGGGEIRQYLDVHVYWKPVPGKTPSNPSTLDATLCYAIQSPSGVAIYRGSGFVYLKERRWSDKLIGKLESGRLRLDTRIGSAAEFIGDATMSKLSQAYLMSNARVLRLREMTDLEPQKRLRNPRSVRFDDQGRMYIPDFGSFRVKVYQKDVIPLEPGEIDVPLRAPTLFTV